MEIHRANLIVQNKEWPSIEGTAEAPGTGKGEQSGQEEVDSDLREHATRSSLLAIICTRFA